jgi:hypothetical protein
MEALAKEFEGLGYTVDRSFAQHGVVVICGFAVGAGPHAGKTIDVGVAGKDFPFTPPAGIQVRPHIMPVGQRNISNSPLGAEWQYWSRQLPNWGAERTAKHIISYINKVLLDA